jgi:predicted nucleic acid-binding protein
MIIIADTTPLNYLILIGEVDALRQLYGSVIVPPAVREELTRASSPKAVRAWITAVPSWIEVRSPELPIPILPNNLGPGEREAIALAEELHADQLIVDDRPARREAEKRGFSVIGTFGILQEAALEGYLDLRSSIDRLRLTNFHISPDVLAQVLGSAT